GIRDGHVTGVQTCALPIYPLSRDSSSIQNLPVVPKAINLMLSLEVASRRLHRYPPEVVVVCTRQVRLHEPHLLRPARQAEIQERSEERRVGKEGRRRSAMM